ncbi:unnamed protein product [Bursaphelenchus okinawaensis]|uniref:Uncharacterized protein n=1 Tax=Bursaphelenchus okinawaensis TaxID=465554 RepID=A0A811K8C0_9BILA|nr:unnamed protein product [Bursaphelenchus okinawaensis]CAG9095483.1 unnamed protein product [Bursaphelenchus okinawaensis]
MIMTSTMDMFYLFRTLSEEEILDNVVERIYTYILAEFPKVVTVDDVIDYFDEFFRMPLNQVVNRLGYKNFTMFCKYNKGMNNMLDNFNGDGTIKPIIFEYAQDQARMNAEAYKQRQEEERLKRMEAWQKEMERVIKGYEEKGHFPTDDELEYRQLICQCVLRGMQDRKPLTHSGLNGYLKEYGCGLNAELYKHFQAVGRYKSTPKMNDILKAMSFEIRGNGKIDTIIFSFQPWIPSYDVIIAFYEEVKKRREEFLERHRPPKTPAKSSPTVDWE